MQAHPWKLVAPWYRWPRQIKEEKVAKSHRDTRPVFQKFDRPNFVEGFLQDPQRSLRFKETVDRIHTVELVAAPLLDGGIFGRSGKVSPSLYAPRTDPTKDPTPQRARLVPTTLRKIFLETHRRYYLVVCELHCDVPGFPSARADEVCQAGFVVRRRYLSVPAAAQKEALALLKAIVSLEAQVADLDETAPLKPRAAQKRAEKVAKMKEDGTFGPARAALFEQLELKRKELQTWKVENGAKTIHEGWVPGAFDGVGRWQLLEDESPQEPSEVTYPLYPLFPNPQNPEHDAKGRALFFGVLPTSSLDTDERGQARFDTQSLYEVRCFVRRHKPECPRRPETPDCHGELVWSEPTEAYRLAPVSDLVGTSNRPITIQAPDLEELAAQAATMPFGQFSPVRVVRKQQLSPTLDGTSLKDGKLVAQQAVCFFAIPLITLVALFVLQIFLPIVVFLFGLWFLLVFKFCIPPEFQVNMALQAELQRVGELGINVDAAFELNVLPPSGSGVPFPSAKVNPQTLNDFLADRLADGLATREGLDKNKVKSGLGSGFSNKALAALHEGLASLATQKTDPVVAGPDLLANLEYEPRVKLSEVVGL